MNLSELLNKQKSLNEELIVINKEIDKLANDELRLSKLDIIKELQAKEDKISVTKKNIDKLKNKATTIIKTGNFTDKNCYEALFIILKDLENIESNLNNTILDCNLDTPKIINSTKKSSTSNINPSENNINMNKSISTETSPEKVVLSSSQKSSPNYSGSKNNSNIDNINTSFNKNIPTSEKKSFEFNIGTNALYIIGVLLILISLITFGRFVYVNFLSDLMKGICLFILSSSLVIIGETILKKRKSWFCIASLSLGISGLYISLIINYLFLSTLSSTTALILTIIITIISMYVSKRNTSNILRILTLLGGYLCLIPLELQLPFTESLVTVIILILITATNMLIPINNKVKISTLEISFEAYSSIISLIFYFAFSFVLNLNAVIVLAVAYAAIYNYMFIRCNKNNSILHNSILTVTSLIVPLFLFTSESFITITLAMLCLLCIQLISLWLSRKYTTNWIFYIQSLITSLLYLTMLKTLNFTFGTLDVYIGIISLLLITSYLYYEFKNTYTSIAFFAISIISFLDFITPNYYFNLFITTSYILCYILIFTFANIKAKETNFTKVMRGFMLFSLEYYLYILLEYFDIDVSTILLFMLILAYVYILMLNYIKVLRFKDIIEENTIYIAVLTILTLLIGLMSDINFYVSTVLFITSISFLMTDKLINTEKFMLKPIYINKPFSYSIFATYTIFRFSFIDTFISDNGVIISILLMIIAFASVFYGFKLKTLSLRRYGLGLSLFICTKLIVADFYYVDFLAKTLLFLIVGLLALGISYIYNKLEKELHK